MKRGLWLIYAVLAFAAAALLQYEPEQLAGAAPAEAASPEIRVRHELVHVPAEALVVEAVPSVKAPAAGPRRVQLAHGGELRPSTRSAPARAPRTATAAPNRSLLGKAGRAVVGDGRYRPEPFPRLKDH